MQRQKNGSMTYKSYQHHKLFQIQHSDLMQVNNENRKKMFQNISKRSTQTLSLSKQKAVSETVVSSQELNFLLYFEDQ